MKKILILVLIVKLFLSCSNDKNSITRIDIENTINHTIDNLIKPNTKNNFLIEKMFCNRINDSLIYSDLIELDSFLTANNIHYMISQYNESKDKSVDLFLSEDNIKFINTANIISDSIIYIEFSPPLFTIDKNYFIVFVISKYNQVTSPKWSGLYFVYEKRKQKWKLRGKIKTNLGQH